MPVDVCDVESLKERSHVPDKERLLLFKGDDDALSVTPWVQLAVCVTV